jgi:hypothetical protein
MLFGLKPTDPITLTGAALLLLVIAMMQVGDRRIERRGSNLCKRCVTNEIVFEGSGRIVDNAGVG